MNIPSIHESFQDDEKFRRGAEMVEWLAEGRAFNDWITVGEGLMVAREAVYARVRTKSEKQLDEMVGRAISQTPYGLLHKVDRADLVWCMKNLPAIEKMREAWQPDERARVAHPNTMRKRFRAYLKATTEPSEATPKKDPPPTLTERLAAAEEENHRLKDIVKNGSNLSPKDTYGDLARTLFTIIVESGIKEKKAFRMLERLEQLLRDHYNKERREWEARDQNQQTPTP